MQAIPAFLTIMVPLTRQLPQFELVAKLRWFTAGGAIRIAVRQLSQTWKLRHYDVIDDVIIWVQDGNCKKMARENFSMGAFYNITKNPDNPIKTVGRDSF